MLVSVLQLVPLLAALPVLPAIDHPAIDAASSAPASLHLKPARSEIYVPVGLALYSGANRLAVGLGGGIGYRYLLSDIASVYGDARLGWYTGVVGVLSAGAMAGFHVRAWNPQLGVGAMLFVGQGVRVLSSAAPDVPGQVAFAPAVRISPLRFAASRFYASALNTDIGCGVSRQRCALALSVSILETGIRF